MQELEDYENDESRHRHQLPDIIIVKKTYPKLAKRQRQRIWKLKHLMKENEDGDNNIHAMKKKSKKEAQNLADREMTDYNEFLQDIEEDPEMRANINLYQDKDVI